MTRKESKNPYRDMLQGDFRELEPIEVIRAKCLYCKGTPNGVKLCRCKKCPLYAFRHGKLPRRGGKGAGT